MLLARDPPVGAAPGLTPPCPPGFDAAIYSTVPTFNERGHLIALTVSFAVFAWICSALRLYVRCIVLHAPGWDDFFMVLALLCTTVCSVFLCISPDFGFGKSIYSLTFPEVEDLMKIMYIGNFPYPLSVVFIKVALLFQYLRIFKAGSKHSLVCKCLVVLVAIWGTIFAVFRWVPCIPLAAYWDLSITNATCWGFGSRKMSEFMPYFVSQAITTSLLDFVVFVIPVRFYFTCHDLRRETRFALLGLFVLGLAVNSFSIWRMVYVIQLASIDPNSFDPTWYSPTASSLANIEVHLAVTCAAMPVFWPNLENKWNKIFVTREVEVTTEYGRFPSKANDVELQSTSSNKNLTLNQAQISEGWEPFVGDETTGLGENETVVVSPATTKRIGFS